MRALHATACAVRISALLVAAALPLNGAFAHTVSIGYEFVGPGAVRFWYGSYHASATFNEADLQLVGPTVNSVVAYSLLSSTKPGGLVDGVNNFYSNTAGTALVGTPQSVSGNGGSFDPATQSVVNWQGVGFTGLAPGTYTFTYNPLGAPTVEWNPINDVIRTGSFTLTVADVLGIDGFRLYGTNQNQQAVGSAIDSWINGGSFNQTFYNLALLAPGGQLPAALSQLSGEALTQAVQAGFQDMGAFLTAMLDPFGGSGGMRGGDFGAGHGGGAGFGSGFGGFSGSGLGASSGAGFGGAGYVGSPYGGSLYGGSPYGSAPYGTSPYGTSAYGSSPYGASPYGSSPYGSSPYGSSPYGSSPYGASPYGSSPYGNSPYGSSPYGNSPHGNSPYGISASRNPAPAPARDPRCGAIYDRRNPASDPCWGAWMTPYGSYARMSGDAAIGSHDTSLRSAGVIAGVDYRFAPGGVIGIAMSGGSNRWGLSDSLGGGSTEILQGGVYASQRVQTAYLSAAFAYARQSVSTDRMVTVSGTDHLGADYVATGYGGRIEAGNRFGNPRAGVTPYAATQMQRWDLPAYAETALSGSGVFGLSVDARGASDLRSELGLWLDRLIDIKDGRLLMRGRTAWMHSWHDAPIIEAAFQALPGSNFTATGAAIAADALQVSFASELRFAGGWSASTKIDAEFASGSQSYGLNATLRYQW